MAWEESSCAIKLLLPVLEGREKKGSGGTSRNERKGWLIVDTDLPAYSADGGRAADLRTSLEALC